MHWVISSLSGFLATSIEHPVYIQSTPKRIHQRNVAAKNGFSFILDGFRRLHGLNRLHGVLCITLYTGWSMDVAKKSLKLEIIQCIYILLKHFLRKSLYILCIYSVVQCIYTGLSSGLRVMQIVGGPEETVVYFSLSFA